MRSRDTHDHRVRAGDPARLHREHDPGRPDHLRLPAPPGPPALALERLKDLAGNAGVAASATGPERTGGGPATTATAPGRKRTAARTRPALPLHLLFLGSVALIALHVIDDSFLQPQPGTSAADHLVSGLVPLSALALAAAAYLRVRAGGRAVIALVAGFFGVVVGIEAVHYTTHGGPSGDDFTGLLAIPAGLALLGLGCRRSGRAAGATRVWSARRCGAAPSRLRAVGCIFILFRSGTPTSAPTPPGLRLRTSTSAARTSRTSSCTRATV